MREIPKWLKLEEGEEYVRGFPAPSEEVVSMIIVYVIMAMGSTWAGFALYGNPLKYPPYPLALAMFFYAIRLFIFHAQGRVTAHLTSHRLFVTNNHSLTRSGYALIPLDSVLSVKFAEKTFETGTVRIIYNRKGKRRRYNVSIGDFEDFIEIVSARIPSSSASDNPVAKECSGNA